MDIFDFIDGEEQRDFLKKNHYEFTAAEAAYIVCNSNATIKEKYGAIEDIINSYDDCEMLIQHQVENSSTLDYLRKYNSIIEKYYSKMFAEPDESVYSVQVWYIGYSPEAWVGGLKTFDEVLEELGFYDQDQEFTFKIRREWDDEYVELDHNPEGKPYKMSFKGTKEENELLSTIQKVEIGLETI